MNYPGWRVEAGGRDHELLTADGYFRAAALPAGDWQLRFVYDPPGMAALAWLRRAAFIVMLALLGFELWRRRRAPAREGGG